MIHYRTAISKDAAAIGALHAKSWQQNYRGSLKDDYLDNHVEAERLTFWTKRLEKPPKNEHIIIAEQDEKLIGFSCICLDDDPKWGALIDNLHVAKSHSSKGIGRTLMQKSAKWIKAQNPNAGFYLWVLTSNTRGIQFYERLGGIKGEKKSETIYGGSSVLVYRIIWNSGSL